jgi:oxygen-independent coproporphyrinogen-3 oxidase
VPRDARVEQLHWGGGTPTFLSPAEMGQLMGVLHKHFTFAQDGEYSIEVDPRTVNEEIVACLAALGFNRMSLGVQDFDPNVQRAVNRVQSKEQTLAALDSARRAGFRSVNIDLIYGLPRQTVAGFERTLDAVITAAPDRIALYNYAHVPQLFKAQRRINAADLPSPDTKLQIMMRAVHRLREAGYQYIGMDHFALADDALCVAQRQGRLHRNFQGYSTHAECDLLAFGVSAIGAIGPTYHQNYRTLEEYYDSLDRGELPVMRGVELNADDLLRRAVIQALMCNFSLSFEAIEVAFLVDFAEYFATELKELEEFERDGLVRLEEGSILVTDAGRFLMRNICMVFDRYLRLREQRAQYSKVI